MKDWHILLVEDDPDGREVVARILRFNRIPFSAADNAEEALEKLAVEPFSAAILDLALPGMDGWTLLSQIQNNPALAHMRCVAVTAFHSSEVAVKAIEAGFLAYFPKPLDSTSFVRELQRVLA